MRVGASRPSAQPGRLIARVEALTSIEHVLDAVDRGQPSAIEVVGEAGIGKTRLLRELATRADERGQLVLTGGAAEFERDLPFSVFVDALDQYVAGLDSGRLAALDARVRSDLARVFPSLPGRPENALQATVDERYRSHRAVRVLLEHLARPRPL